MIWTGFNSSVATCFSFKLKFNAIKTHAFFFQASHRQPKFSPHVGVHPGAFQRFVVNCLHSVHSDSMVADFSHKSPLQTENYSTFHADSVLAASCHSQEGISQYASTHFPLIFPRVIEMSIHSHHQCGVQHYGSFPLIHINPASQSTIEWGQQSFTKTGLLVSNLLASVPLSPTKADSTMTTMTGFGRPKVEPCRKLYFANVIVPTLNFHAVVGR